MKPGVSFVVPVYNKAPWLAGVLDAIRNQAGDFERDYVFVDDGSDDNSLDIVRSATSDWDNVVIHTQVNHGSGHATNRGVERAEREFIKFVDADDLMPRRATETLLTALRSAEDCGLAWGRLVNFETPEEVDFEAHIPDPDTRRIARPLELALRNSMFNPTQILVRTAWAQEAGGCDERIVHSQEYGLSLRLARRGPFLEVDAPIAFQLHHAPGGLSADCRRQIQRVTKACALFVRDHPDLDVDLKQLACRRAAGRAWNFQRRHRGAGFGSAWYRHYLRSKLPIGSGHAEFLDACVAAFDD
ncbi:MAG: hypothetical protein CL566_06510 [Alphaproteobacteria bacterium]|mgnify:CR=1 FL=1|nr:hypothetical protein [Alphaproteobacteria bacterium]